MHPLLLSLKNKLLPTKTAQKLYYNINYGMIYFLLNVIFPPWLSNVSTPFTDAFPVKRSVPAVIFHVQLFKSVMITL